MKRPKELFINSIRQVRIHGSTVIPTAVLYKENRIYTGLEAYENSASHADIREDFKVEIGNDDPLKLAQIQNASKAGHRRSILGIAKDFFESVLKEALGTIEVHGLKRPSRILIAEPLALTASTLSHDEWLKNYRQSIRRILSGKFDEIDFMPEPFAVFQYYRYGIRHALVAQKQKHVALVLDFGGGTFDASVIETAASGDISQSGRNSRPLAACSVPIGGFYINRVIAEDLLFKSLGKTSDKAAVRAALTAFPKLKNLDEEDLSQHRQDHANFARNFRRMLHSVEQAKIAICTSIGNWRLDADLSKAPGCPAQSPLSPLQESSLFAPVRLEAITLRSLFETQIWKQKILPAIKDTLSRAASELGGRPISIVLLSGGSSNIRWLKPLMERDLPEALRQAEILELSENFQEIVAKGLAIECARRFHTEGSGDFRAITYNRLCLGLEANRLGLELKKFSPQNAELGGTETEPGVLLPSATSLRGLIGKPLHWKVRPNNLPTQMLDYYFMRSSFDPEDIEARQNLETRITTPKSASIGRTVEVELLVREDGTAEPAFIYGHGSQNERNTVVKGRPFYLDMTFATEDSGSDTYLGFDFGTSTSSICYVDGADIKTYMARSTDATWLGLNALVDVLPYTVAAPLTRFVAETGAEQMERSGREAFEAMLTLGAYLVYTEHRSIAAEGAIFKGLQQRSAGPLWAMVKNCANATGRRWEVCQEIRALLQPPAFDEFEHAVSQVALSKHGKRAGIDYPRLLERFGNALAKIFQGRALGYFEDARHKQFSMDRYVGNFRSIRGPTQPFIHVFEFEGPKSFPSEFLFLFDVAKGSGLPLFPLFVRGLDDAAGHGDRDLFMFDIARGSKEIAYRAVQEREEIVLTPECAFESLYNSVQALRATDGRIEPVTGFKFRSRLVEDE